jgi:hypothetical protein
VSVFIAAAYTAAIAYCSDESVGDFITHRRPTFAFAEPAQFVIELMNQFFEGSANRLIESRAVPAGRKRLQAGQTSFDRATLVVITAFVAIFVSQMDFDPLQLRHESAESFGNGRFDIARQVFTAVDVIVSRDVNEHKY